MFLPAGTPVPRSIIDTFLHPSIKKLRKKGGGKQISNNTKRRGKMAFFFQKREGKDWEEPAGRTCPD